MIYENYRATALNCFNANIIFTKCLQLYLKMCIQDMWTWYSVIFYKKIICYLVILSLTATYFSLTLGEKQTPIYTNRDDTACCGVAWGAFRGCVSVVMASELRHLFQSKYYRQCVLVFYFKYYTTCMKYCCYYIPLTYRYEYLQVIFIDESV